MDKLSLQSLVAAVEAGSLTAAARRLGVTQPAISLRLSMLERVLGQQLLVRSRRGVRPTSAGSVAYEHGLQVLAGIEQMQGALDALKGAVTGRLRITASMMLSQTIMGPLISELHLRHPGLRIDLVATDTILDIAAEGIDIALRSGTMGHGGGRVRKIGVMEGVLVATPAYLDAAGWPAGPEDLKRLSYIQYREDPEEHEINLESSTGRIRAPVRPAFAAQHPELALHAVLSGIGFAKAPRFTMRERLASGQLAEVLPGYAPAAKPLYLVQLDHLRDSPTARAFREALLDHLATIEGMALTPDHAAA